MVIHVRIPSWTPCKVDPVSFDCSECEIGWSSCRLKTDDSLRHYFASLSRRRNGVSPTSYGFEVWVEELVASFLETHGLSVTAQILLEYLAPEIPPDVSEAKLRHILMQSSRFVETSPGMFNLAPGRIRSGSELPGLTPSSGTLLEDLLSRANLLARDEQLVKFKRLAGYRFFITHHPRTREIAAKTIRELSDWALNHRGWSEFDIYKFAVGPDGVAQAANDMHDIASEDDLDRTHRLLSALSATEWGDFGSIDSTREAFRELRDELILANLKLVSSQAIRWARGQFPNYADLFQEGFFGLTIAIDRFDPYRGNQFSTYATPWIRQRITRSVANFERTIRIPVHLHDRISDFRHALDEHYRELGHKPTVSELSARLGWNTAEVAFALSNFQEVDSLDSLLDDPSRSFDGDAAFHVNPTEMIVEQIATEDVEKVLNALNDREAKILRLRFGLGEDGYPHTLEEIGKIYGVTRERIRQIESKAKKKILRKYQYRHFI